MSKTLPLAVPPPQPAFERDSYASTALAEIVDRSLHAATARFTAGLSPMALAGAYLDWAAHLAFSPGKQMQLAQKALRKATRLGAYSAVSHHPATPCCIEPLPQDRRFDAPGWHAWPYNVLYQSFLLVQQWWSNATTGVRGVSARHEAIAEFATRQWLDMFSPSNYPWTNPEVAARTAREAGLNLAPGAYVHMP